MLMVDNDPEMKIGAAIVQSKERTSPERAKESSPVRRDSLGAARAHRLSRKCWVNKNKGPFLAPQACAQQSGAHIKMIFDRPY